MFNTDYFVAMFRIMVKKGLITRKEFDDELDEMHEPQVKLNEQLKKDRDAWHELPWLNKLNLDKPTFLDNKYSHKSINLFPEDDNNAVHKKEGS